MSNNIEKNYPRFFSRIVRIFLIIMIAAFVFNIAELVMDDNKAQEAGLIAVNGGELSYSLSGSILMTSVTLLSASLIITLSFLSYLFYRDREVIYALVTASIVIIIFFSALSLFF